ncbi:hypothetical protein Sste5346_004128 [Sporothrix stenoceras]|uniref:Pre-mRNA splicing factor n=1 Tax=Sporothrix stenoceras TaxID=5173 RepID=A0ABR3ZAW3_9PEZI
MTRTSIYGAGTLAFLGTTAMTVAATVIPNWVFYITYPTAGGSDPYWMSLGLHKSCKSDNTTPFSPLVSSAGASSSSYAAGTCRSFPSRTWDCGVEPEQQVFCTVWRTIGWLMAVALVAEFVTLIGFLVMLCGGRMRREYGWRILVPMVEGVALLQLCAMALVTYLMDHDDRFLVPGWHLGTSWTLCTVSWSLAALTGMGLAAAAYMLPPEDGYELLLNPEEA